MIRVLIINFCLTVSIATAIVNSSYAQQYQDSLNSYVEIALLNNPQLKKELLKYNSSLEKVNSVGSLPDPQFEMGYYLRPMELISGKQVADFKIMQMFPWFGALDAAREEMKFMAESEWESYRIIKNDVFFNVESIWLEIYMAKKKTQIIDKNLELLRMVERLALVKYKTGGAKTSYSGGNSGMQQNNDNDFQGTTGMGGMESAQELPKTAQNEMSSDPVSMEVPITNSSLIDIYKIKSSILELQNDSVTLESQFVLLVAKFNFILGREMNTPVFFPDTLPIPENIFSYSEVSDSLFFENPILSMLELEGKAIDSRSLMAKKMRYPMLGAGLSYSIISKDEMSLSDMNGKDMIMPMVTISIPINQKKYKAIFNEAKIHSEANKQEIANETNRLKIEYLTWYQKYLDAFRKYNLTLNQKELLKKSLDLLVENYINSISSLNDILIVQKEFLDFQLKNEEAKSGFYTAVSGLGKIFSYPKNTKQDD